jgi:DNA repair protein RecO (recombination protein O)
MAPAKAYNVSEPHRTERLYRCEAIVLHGIDFKEADRILTLYSKEQGKVSVIAKGIRKTTSRLGYGLDHLSHVRLMLAHGRELDVVTGVELIDGHLSLAGNVEAYAYASHIAELVNRLTQDRQENRRLFELLSGAIAVISEGVDPGSVARYVEMSLFSLLGYRIELYRCVSCDRELQAVANPLSARLGGFLCPSCQGEDRAAILLSVGAQKYLRLLDRGGLEQTVRRDINEDLRRELELAMIAYARYHAEHDLTSLNVLHSLESLGAP